MRTFIKNNWLYFLLYLSALSVSAYYLFQLDKVSLHLKINKLVGNPITDTFFKYFTHVGDGIFAVIVGVIILFLNIRNGIFVLGAYIISGITTSILKNYFYSDVNRPHFVFDFFVYNSNIRYVDGVDMMGMYSFPSGHSTSAFAVFTAMALLTENKFLKIIFFLLALLSAFSRTYLSQHWLVDITVGSIIGTVTALVMYYILIHSNTLKNLNKPLLNLKKTNALN